MLRAAGLQPLAYYIQKRRATVAATIAARPILEECRGAERLRGTPVRATWWEQVLTLSPEPARKGNGVAPSLGALLAPTSGRTFPPGHPHHQPHQESTSLEDQQAARRTEWEARDLGAEAEQDRL